ncbi:MAG TPA: SEC-C metal-binding domain-containing protein [Candidatus Polarisedimenticolaceae bacterium]|nr:SEC-C metal-binding domain-containing protein [Candidatus Polarisedimenticolaceae bacterium]
MSSRRFRTHSKVVWPGFSNTPSPRHILKVGRNDPCPCGSGKKYKDCHVTDGSAYLEKLALDKGRERAREIRREARERGVPWYKRIFYRA